MSSASQVALRSAEIAKVLVTEEDLRIFQCHLAEVLHGEAFKGSQRSGQFLRYVIEQSIHGHCDELKERVIGVELFGRPPSYDTGEDAIVRVTASDVRKRLLQHYDVHGSASGFRIRLPSGSYIPEISREAPAIRPVRTQEQPNLPTAQSPIPAFTRPAPADVVDAPVPVWHGETTAGSSLQSRAIWALTGLFALNVLLWVAFWLWMPRRASASSTDGLWAAMFDTGVNTDVITSDPDVAEIQRLTGQRLTLSDYANGRYIPDPTKTTPQLVTLARDTLRGVKSAAVDTKIAVDIARMVSQSGAGRFTIQNARDVRVADLSRDGNYVLIGSPTSDPWALYFSDHLDFRFVFDEKTGQEIIENLHPRTGEAPEYIPTAKGFATGQSFATVSYLPNPDRRGHVLLIAGANAEGTEAAGDLIANPSALSAAIRKCGLASQNRITSFQFLLRLSTIAGSPKNFDVIACHSIQQ